MFVQHVDAFLELHHLRHVSGRYASLEEQDVPVDLVHTIASFALHRASRWLVEPCRCLGSLSRSGTLFALTSQYSASCLSVNHAMFAVECPNHQTSEAKSVWAGRFVLLLVQSQLSPCSHVHQLPGADVRANCICAIMRCKMESELKFNAFNPLPHLFAGENVVDV